MRISDWSSDVCSSDLLAPAEVPEGVVLAYEYDTFCINSPVYCEHLLRKFLLQGGKTLEKDLRSEWEAFTLRNDVILVVNASGTGFGDRSEERSVGKEGVSRGRSGWSPDD